MKALKLNLLLLFGLFFSGLQSQTMYVRPTTGAQASFIVANIQKIAFLNGDLVVTNTSGANFGYALSSLRYLYFTDLTLGTEEQLLVSPSFYVYPNPVDNVLHLAGNNSLQRINKIDIISLEGRLLMQQNQHSNSPPQVEVNSLPKGFYLCKITSDMNSQTIKFFKK